MIGNVGQVDVKVKDGNKGNAANEDCPHRQQTANGISFQKCF
jgi:hypothetical protein